MATDEVRASEAAANEDRAGGGKPEDGRPRIVVGFDGSEPSKGALAWAAAEAERLGARLELHTAMEPGYAFVTPKEVDQALKEQVDEAVARVHELAPKVAAIGVTHQQSPPAALIEASQGAAMLVVGSRGRGGFVGMLLGSVSMNCVLHAHCPVVVVRQAQTGS